MKSARSQLGMGTNDTLEIARLTAEGRGHTTHVVYRIPSVIDFRSEPSVVMPTGYVVFAAAPPPLPLFPRPKQETQPNTHPTSEFYKRVRVSIAAHSCTSYLQQLLRLVTWAGARAIAFISPPV